MNADVHDDWEELRERMDGAFMRSGGEIRTLTIKKTVDANYNPIVETRYVLEVEFVKFVGRKK